MSCSSLVHSPLLVPQDLTLPLLPNPLFILQGAWFFLLSPFPLLASGLASRERTHVVICYKAPSHRNLCGKLASLPPYPRLLFLNLGSSWAGMFLPLIRIWARERSERMLNGTEERKEAIAVFLPFFLMGCCRHTLLLALGKYLSGNPIWTGLPTSYFRAAGLLLCCWNFLYRALGSCL